MINGRKKIPIFQLFDIPVVTRGESIKIRTNIATIMIYKDREEPSIRISFLGKKVALSLILCAYYSMDEVVQKFGLDLPIDENSDNFYEILRKDLKMTKDESVGYTQDDFIVELGRTYSKYNAKSKGEDILYAIDLIQVILMIRYSQIKELDVLNI